MVKIVASDNVRYIDYVSRSTKSDIYVKLYSLTMTDSYTGSWKINFSMMGFPTCAGYGQIRINGVPYGTERINNTGSLISYSETFNSVNVVPGDTIELWVRRQGSGYYIVIGMYSYTICFDIINEGSMFLMF